MSVQHELFEPTGAEVVRLAMEHRKKASAAFAQAQIAETYGWASIASFWRRQAVMHDGEAEALAMLADLEALAGVAA